MATFYYSVYQSATEVAIGAVEQKGKITVAGASAQGDVITGTTGVAKRIRIVSDTACQYEKGTDPTADGDSEFFPAGTIEYQWLEVGDRFAVIEQQ